VVREPGHQAAGRRRWREFTQDRLAALEQTVQQLVHFISTELRPDLSQSALQDGSDAAKQDKDLKDAEKQSES